jgi:ferritin-like metal-binding protein YciE
MGMFSKDIHSIDDIINQTQRDIYYAEQQIEKSLPKMMDKARNATLRQRFEEHLAQTRGHIDRVEQVFRQHGVDANAVRCQAIDGILAEADEISGEAEEDVLDAALVAAAQAVEHYEITRYGTLVAWAKELGRADCASLLQQNLDKENAADAKLTKVAEERVNRVAA